MLSPTALEAGRTIRLCRKDRRYYAAVDGLAVFGVGDTYEAAVSELDRRFGELHAFGEETGLAPDTLAPGRAGGPPQWASSLRKAAIVVVCFWLLMVPLSYALSTALERTVTNLQLKGGREFWRSIEESLIKSAGQVGAPSPEEHARTMAALRIVVQRIQPYADEIKPIFGCARSQ